MDNLNSSPEMGSVEPGHSSLAKNPLVIILAGVVLIIAIFALIGWWVGRDGQLSEEEKMKVLEGVKSNELTEEERLKVLQTVGTSSVSAEEQIRIMQTLKKEF